VLLYVCNQVQEVEQKGVIAVIFDYAKLEGRIKEIFKTNGNFASAMGMSEHTVSCKLNNKTRWTDREMCKAADILMFQYSEIPLYFFVPKVQ
jgi:hypothetical protein